MYVPAYIEDEVNEAMKIGKAEGMQIGKAEGMQIGKAEGIHQGEARMLLHLLALKFGFIADDVRQKIDQADEAQILIWSSKIFAAQSLADIFQ